MGQLSRILATYGLQPVVRLSISDLDCRRVRFHGIPTQKGHCPVVHRRSDLRLSHQRRLYRFEARRDAPVYAIPISYKGDDWNYHLRYPDWNNGRDNGGRKSKPHQSTVIADHRLCRDNPGKSDLKKSGDSVEFLQPHAGCLVQCLAHASKRSVGNPPGAYVHLIVNEAFLNNVQSSL
jgi:hypothetical protein